MLLFARTCDAIAATTKKLEKTALVAAYLRCSLQSSLLSEAAAAAIFLSGRPFPAYEEATLQVGGALLWRVIGELSGKSEHELTGIYRRHGDAGSVAAEALPDRPESGLALTDVQRAFTRLLRPTGQRRRPFFYASF
jgi:DNA ligase 1